MRRWIVTGAMVLGACAVVMTGCGSDYNSKAHINAAVKYMSDKYGVEFSFLKSNTKPGSGDVFGRHSEYVNILVSTDTLPGKEITVFSNDGESFGDNYINLKYEDRAAADIGLIAGGIYGGDPVKVILNSSERSSLNDGDPDMTYEEFLRSGWLDWTELCTDDGTDSLNDYRRLVRILQDRGINCQPAVFLFVDDSYEEVTKQRSPYAIDQSKYICELRLDGFDNILDESFDGRLNIIAVDGRQTEVPLDPPADETPDAYAEYFAVPGQEEDSE